MLTKGYTLIVIFMMALVISACGGEVVVDSNAPHHQAQQGQHEELITRVVALDGRLTDYLVALDLPPLGATVRLGGEFERYLSVFLTDTQSVGQSATPNLETILSLNPQLIIGTEKEHMKSEEPLSLIATTVILGNAGMERDWQAAFKQVAEATGRSEQAAQVLDKLAVRTAELAQRLAPQTADMTVAFMSLNRKDARILGNRSMLGQIIYEQLGLKYPSQLADEDGETVVSIETLPTLNPDFIFVIEDSQNQAESLAELMESPVLKELDAVKTGAYAPVGVPVDKASLGPVMLQLFLDDVEKALLNTL